MNNQFSFSQIKQKLNLNVNTVLLSLYVSFVWFAYLFAYYLDKCSSMGVFLGLVLVMTVISFLVIPKVIGYVSKVNIEKGEQATRKDKLRFFAISFVVIFAYFLLWFIAYYPGGFHADSLGQFQQVAEGWWHDWNPVWHTIICFGLPYFLTHKVGAIILAQIIYMSLILAYAGETIYEYANKKWACIATMLVVLNPFVGINAVIADKDVDFGLACLFLFICAMRISLSKGEWEKEWWKMVPMAFALGCSFLFRHNGPLFTLTMVIALFFVMNKKRWLLMTGAFLVMVILIKGPLYSKLDAVHPGGRVVETMGLPLTIIGNVVVEHPEAMDEEVKEYVYAMGDQQFWEEFYVCGNFNEIKFRDNFHLGIVDDEGRGKALHIMMKCIKASPQSALKAAFRLTGLVYGIDGETDDKYLPTIGDNKFYIIYKGNINLKSFFEVLNDFSRNTFLRYFCRYTGVANLIVLICMMAKCKLNSKEDWKKIGICLPLFAYNYGTMILLTAPDVRFFFLTFIMYPIMSVYLICSGAPKGEDV